MDTGIIVTKKPVAVAAILYTGLNAFQVTEWAIKHHGAKDVLWAVHGCLEIKTLEGTMTASPGDWIICGVLGEFYPCKPAAFDLSYDRPKT